MKSLSPYLVIFSGLKEGVHLFDFEIGNKFFKNFDYYDFADANIKTILELEKKPTLLNLKFRFNGEVEDDDEMSTPKKTEELEDGSKLELWNLRRDRFDSQNNLISRFVLTTVGRVVMNYTIIDSVSET